MARSRSLLPAALREDLDEVVALLTLGAGLLGLFLGVENWWVIFVIGWVVLTPLANVLTGGDEADDVAVTPAGEEAEATTQDALDALRERYARGDLSEAEFERKVERLLETETPEQARRHVGDGEHDRERRRQPERDRER